MSERSPDSRGERVRQPEKKELSRAEALAMYAEKMSPLRRERLTRGLKMLEAVFKGTPLSRDPLERIDAIASARQLLSLKAGMSFSKYDASYDPKIFETNRVIREQLYRTARSENWPFIAVKNGKRDEEGFALFVKAFVRAEQAKVAEARFADRAITDSWMPDEDIYEFDSRLENLLLDAQREIESRNTPELLQKFPDAMRTYIANNVAIMELTEGCSVRCTFCAFNAPGEVGASVPFSDIAWLMRRGPYDQHYYYATDPLDYRDASSGKERTYADVLALAGGKYVSTATAYPRTAKDVMSVIADRVSRISLSKMNRKRLQNDDFLTITEGGSIIPTNPDLAQALLTHSQPAQTLYNLVEDSRQLVSGKNFVRAHEDGHADGDAVGDSIACRNGVIYSPKKVRNTLRMMSTVQYPLGVAEQELLPENVKLGSERVSGIVSRVKAGEKVLVDELLRYSVVRGFDNTYHPSAKSLTGRTISREELGECLSPVRVLVWNEARQAAEGWSAMYDMVSGYISRIDEGNVPEIANNKNKKQLHDQNERDHKEYARKYNPNWVQ